MNRTAAELAAVFQLPRKVDALLDALAVIAT